MMEYKHGLVPTLCSASSIVFYGAQQHSLNSVQLRDRLYSDYVTGPLEIESLAQGGI